jgi:uncharacterized membrane protein YeaQ/YmgE (transglycosylase-associated protein family)
MPTQLSRAPAFVIFGIAGAFVGGAVGSAWGVDAASFLGVGVVWWQLALVSPGAS